MTHNQIEALVQGYNSELLEGEDEITVEEMVKIMELEMIEVDEFFRE